jgi:DNA-binding NtrC family response regulator
MADLNALIIDDETDICVLLAAILKQIGINASFAGNLHEGQKTLELGRFHLLFLDNKLPDGSGLEQLSRFKQNFPELKIIMISAFDGDKEHETAKRNGAIDFISKPLSGSAIRSALKKHFKNLNF